MGMVGWISQLLALGGLSGARPFLTLGILAAYARYTLGVREELWLTSDIALGLCLVLSIVEHLVRTDADVEEWLGGPLAILSALSGAMAASVLLALGEEPGDWESVYGGSPPDALQDLSSVTQMSVMGLSGASAVGVQWGRRRSLIVMRELAVPSRWIRWIEGGGVAGLLVALLLAPFLALFLLLALTLGAALGAYALRSMLRRLDESQREACTSCGHQLRREALRCPKCGASHRPETLISE